jgi:predicted alternative tryptophan synthase beta-subunit
MALDDKAVKIVLDERDRPTHWYNVVPDLPAPPLRVDAAQLPSSEVTSVR